MRFLAVNWQNLHVTCRKPWEWWHNIQRNENCFQGNQVAHGISILSKMSYEQSKYPSQWKTGQVKVLYKGGDSADCGNYRRLTMLSIPSKVAEWVLCDIIDAPLNEELHDKRSGYRKGISSESLLLSTIESWDHYIDQGNVIGATFIDFRKAFDSVCPVILSRKLQYCGISIKISHG